jgi:hypothetical protein
MAGDAVKRVWVFIDGQNLYRDARDAFHPQRNDDDPAPASHGYAHPETLAALLLSLIAANRGVCQTGWVPTITVELPAEWGTIFGAALAFLALDLYLIGRWRRQITAQRTAKQLAAAEEERGRALEAAGVTFTAKAWPPYGSPHRPEQAPLVVAVHGGPAWVHEVRLSLGSRDRGPRSAATDIPCLPWSGDMPVRLHQDRDLPLDWPAPPMVEPEPISWELDVVWSTEHDGPTAEVIVPGGETNWRHA